MLEFVSKYKNQIIEGLVSVLVIICFIGTVGVLFKACTVHDKVFTAKIDSLHKVNDSLLIEINRSNNIIGLLNDKATEYYTQLQKEKGKINVIHDTVLIKIGIVKKYDSSNIVEFYKSRYPLEYKLKDTLIPLNKPVLLRATEDLVKYDGALQELKVKDTIISINESLLANKDSIITKYKVNEINYNKLILNKSTEISDWNVKYLNLYKENKDLRFKNKANHIWFFIVVGGLSYLLITK
jgi:hypothetical protein